MVVLAKKELFLKHRRLLGKLSLPVFLSQNVSLVSVRKKHNTLSLKNLSAA